MNLGSHWQKLALISLPLFSIALLPGLAQGSSQPIAQGVNCNNPQTTADMRICADGQYKAADKKMNQCKTSAAGLEPAADRLEICYSIQLSYAPRVKFRL